MPFFRGLTPEDEEQARTLASEIISAAHASREQALRTRSEESIGTTTDFIRVLIVAASYAVHDFVEYAKKRQPVAINIPNYPEEVG